MPKREVTPNGAPIWIDLISSDTAKSRAFYGELFGWTADEPREEFGGYTNLKKDGLMVAGLMNKVPEMGEIPDVWSVYLCADDIKQVASAAVSTGGSVVVEPMDVGDLGTMAVFTDAGQANIGAWQPGEHKGIEVLEEHGTPSWFELHTRDYDASVNFYKQVFGWDVFVVADEPGFRYTTRADGPGGMLAGIMDATAFLPEGVPAHWSIYFEVDDVDAALAKAVELGGSIVQPGEDTPYGRLATAADPTGAVFKLRTSPKA